MRTTISVLSFLALALGLRAQQTIAVTPQTLAGWTVSGADPQALSQQTGLSLPAGAQLARSFMVSGLNLKVTTKAAIGQNAGDWPVLEISDAALVFARNGSAGKLVLVLGDNAPLDLPYNFALDANGLGVEPVTVSFSRQGAVVSVGMSGQTLQFPAGPAAGSGMEVVASAGTSEAWAFQTLEVTVAAPMVADNTGGQSAGTSGTKAAASDLLAKGRSATSGAGTSALANTSASASGPAVAPGASSSRVTLEIFTPPAVRHGRAAAIRAAAQGKTN